MKLNVANAQLPVARPNPVRQWGGLVGRASSRADWSGDARLAGTLAPPVFQIEPLRRVRAFSLVELLIVMSLLSLIVLALMQVFSSTQRAFRAGVSQSDVMEGGRATMELIASDLRLMAASGGTNRGAVNLSVESNYGYNNAYNPLHQSLPGGPDIRTNLLNAIFILGRENTTWTGTGYFVDHTATKSFYPLYRFYTNTSIYNNPATLAAAFQTAVLNNLASSQWTNMSHIIDGVVHLSLRTYDANGSWLRYDYYLNHQLMPNVSIFQAYNEAQIYFYSNTLPMSVELEFAKLEDHAIKRAESLNLNYTRLTNYLANQSGNVHVFRKHVPIPNADRAAYP